MTYFICKMTLNILHFILQLKTFFKQKPLDNGQIKDTKKGYATWNVVLIIGDIMIRESTRF
jgi:hypothetical protein